MYGWLNITIFSVEALPWNLIVQDHWRWGLLTDHIDVCDYHVTSRHLECVLLASSLQAHRSADKCLALCLYSDGMVQAVTFGYLIYWLVLVNQSIASCYVYSPTPMEASHKLTSSRNRHTKTMFRFQANICYAYPHTNHRKNRSPKFSLSSVAYFTAQTDSRRPVRISPHWINHCCSHIYFAHNYQVSYW